MAADYGALWARVLDELDRTDHTSQVQLEIQSAISHYEKQSWWFNEDVTKTETSTSGPTVGLPDNWIDIDEIHIERNGHPDAPLTKRTWGWYRDIAGDDVNVGSGVPDDYAIYEDTLHLYPVPDQSYTVVFSYRTSFTTLSASSDTNAWCVEGEELIRHRAKAAFRINYGHEDEAIREMNVLSLRDEPFLSTFERIAYNNLRRMTSKRVTGGIRPMRF